MKLASVLLLLLGMDRYSSNGDTTLGFWYFQNPISLNANGTFSGVHTDGDVLLTADFAGSERNAAANEGCRPTIS